MKILWVGDFAGRPEHPWFVGIGEACHELGLNYRMSGDRNTITSQQVDMVVLLGWSHIDMLPQLRAASPMASICVWYQDVYKNAPIPEAWRGIVDHFFLTNSEELDHYRQMFDADYAHYLPQGCNAQGIAGPAPIREVFFSGQRVNNDLHGERTKFLRRLHEAHPISSATEAGAPYQPASVWPSMLLYRQYAISLSVNVMPNKIGATSNRLWNIVSTGGFPLCYEEPWLHDWFSSIKTFRTVEEYEYQVKFWLDHPDDLERERLQTWKEGQERHSMKSRVGELLEIAAD